MRKAKAAIGVAALTVFAFGAIAGSADAAVIIKTIRVTICVTDIKHPDACKNVAADGHVVVSEDALESLEGELGQGATIMEAAGKGAAPSGAQERHGHHHSQQDE
jgi:hypothetical protein